MYNIYDNLRKNCLADFNFEVLKTSVFSFSRVKNSLKQINPFLKLNVYFVNTVNSVMVT